MKTNNLSMMSRVKYSSLFFHNKEWISNNIGDDGISYIGKTLKTNSALTKLDLSCDRQKKKKKKKKKWFLQIFIVLKKIIYFLEKEQEWYVKHWKVILHWIYWISDDKHGIAKKLKDIQLCWFFFNKIDTGIGEKEMRMLEKAMKHNTTLTSLDYTCIY